MVNGKMRTADGQGNWYNPEDPGKYSHETGEFERPDIWNLQARGR